MKKKTLMRSFTIYSLIAFLLTGALLSNLLISHVKKDMLNSLLESTVIRIDEYLILTDSSENVLTSEAEEIDEVFENKFKGYFIGLNILGKNNKLIYSSFIGESKDYSYSDLNIYNSYQANPGIKIINVKENRLKDDLNIEDKVVVATVPIKNESVVVGAYQVFITYNEVKPHLDALYKIIFNTVFGGLLLLYFLLLKNIYTSSRSLEKQNIMLLNKSKELELSYEKISSAYKNTIAALSNAVDARDSYTAGHSERVARISQLIGKSLGLTDNQLKTLDIAALFHDIGKLGVPDEILNKNGKLLAEEYDIIKKHPVIGVNILKSIEFLQEALPMILYHHERMDGKGYPEGKAGDEIPIEARIIAVADTYDAMTSDRPYRSGLSHEIAVTEIINCKGKQFDNKVVDAFLMLQKEL